MTPYQILLSTMLAAAVAAAPQRSLSQDFVPPPPPETYLPPDTPTTPSPEYLPPPPNEEYLPPPENQYLPPPPSEEYLPPPPSEQYLPPPPSEEYLPPTATEEEVKEEDNSSVLPVDSSLGEDAGVDAGAADAQSGTGGGNFDDGQYHPQKFNSGKYDPEAGKYRPVGDDGKYRPAEQVEFPGIEEFDFAYAVNDKESGNNYAVNESNKGGAYKILLPDGRTQIVQYVIDSRGIYRSRITYLQPDGKQ